MCAPITLDDIDMFPPRIQDEVRTMLILTLRVQTMFYISISVMMSFVMIHTWLIHTWLIQ